MFRIFFSVLFSLLLVSAQAADFAHEVDHLRAKVQHGHDTNVELPTPGVCLECELLASGCNAAPCAPAAITFAEGESTPVASSFQPAPALPPPAFYQSRAPPSPL